MLKQQDLIFLSEQSDVIPSRVHIIVSGLQKYLIQQNANGIKKLMIRFRCKGGVIDTIRPSMNSDVVDIFTSNVVRDGVLEYLKFEMGFKTEYVDSPYKLHLITWERDVSETECVEHYDFRDANRILNIGTRYVVDTSREGFTLRLPNNALQGDSIIITDQKGTFRKNNLVIDADNQTIANECQLKLDIDFTTVKLTYIRHENKWILDI